MPPNMPPAERSEYRAINLSSIMPLIVFKHSFRRLIPETDALTRCLIEKNGSKKTH